MEQKLHKNPKQQGSESFLIGGQVNQGAGRVACPKKTGKR